MEWFEFVDGYCERLGPGLLAEPINAVTNLAFLFGAIWIWPRVAGNRPARLLSVVLFAIGLGSGLFHTLAMRWAALADVLPIALFVFIYLFLATRDILGARTVPALAAVLAGIVLIPLASAAFAAIGVPAGAAGYLPLPILILGYAAAAARVSRKTARGLAQGAAILFVSLAFRTVDEPLCGTWPAGTHFLWHILNAIMLTHMIRVYHSHMLAGGTHPR